MHNTLNDPKVNSGKSPLAARIWKDINLIYKTILPRLNSQLLSLGNDNNESVASGVGKYGQQYASLNQNLEAIGQHYNYLKKPAVSKPAKGPTANVAQPLLPGL